MAILRDIVAGHTDPAVLARHRDYRCKASPEEFVASLTGHYRGELVFALRQSIELYDVYQDKIRAVTSRSKPSSAPSRPSARPLNANSPPPPRTKRPRKNEPHFDIRSPLFLLSGGKLLGSATQPSANRAAKTLRLAVMSFTRSGHALAAFYRRLAGRIGKPKAITATARKLAILIYCMLRD